MHGADGTGPGTDVLAQGADSRWRFFANEGCPVAAVILECRASCDRALRADGLKESVKVELKDALAAGGCIHRTDLEQIALDVEHVAGPDAGRGKRRNELRLSQPRDTRQAYPP